MNQTWKIIIAVVIAAIVVGGGVYFWQRNKQVDTPQITQETETQTPAQNPTTSEVQEETIKEEVKTPEKVEETNLTEQQKESPQFSTMDEYVNLALNQSTNSQYKSDRPAGFERIKFGGDLNVAPDGVSASVYVLAETNWSVGSMEDIQTFYLEVVGPSPCWNQPNCNEPNTVNYYGPFQGKLKRLTE